MEVLGTGLLWKEGKVTGAAEEQICSLDSIAAALPAVSGGPLLCSSAAMFLYVSPEGWLSLSQAHSQFLFFLEDFSNEKMHEGKRSPHCQGNDLPGSNPGRKAAWA